MRKCKHLIVRFITHCFGKLLAVVALLSLASTSSLGAGISFSTPVGYPADQVPEAVAVGDFNGDGNLDIAVANLVSNDVSILLGNGDGTFQPAHNYGTGSSPGSIAVGDFNSDGRLDLVVTNFIGGTLSILLGDGDGTFQPAVSISVSGSPSTVVAGDLNGDAKIDLAVALSGTNQLVVLLGDGQGDFRTLGTYAMNGDPTSLITADLNGDGHPDLAVAAGAKVGVLLGNGDGSFQQEEYLPPLSGDIALSVAAGDFNLDGRLDLIVTSRTVCIALSCPLNAELYIGNGDGSFQAALPVLVLKAFGGGGLAIADFNRDGNLDVAIQFDNRLGTPLALVAGNGDGTFQPSVTFSFGLNPVSPVAADLNGDSLPDLVFPDVESADGQTYNVFTLINNTLTPRFTLFVTITGTGTGGVSISPGFHLCGHSCTAGFISGTQVRVLDSPFSGSTFAGWSGACSGTGSCNLVMDSDQSVTATFNVPADFSLTGSALSPGTVAAGQSATGTVTVNPGGGFNSTVLFGCAVQPSASHAPTCAVTPSVSGASVTVLTTAPSFARNSFGSPSWYYALWMPTIGFVCFSLQTAQKNKRNATGLIILGILLLGITFQSACGGGTQVKQMSGGTPPGNYTITVTGTSAALQHTTTFALTVQ
ncbi:MAG TPA: VCBS repeat-containing protein [Candidatus Binatia bacterium]|nr:VCBS repeat-containing protein [Candidatus Binatia bacterium]